MLLSSRELAIMLCHIDAIKNYPSGYFDLFWGLPSADTPSISNSQYADTLRTLRVIKTKPNGSFPLRNIQAIRGTGQMKTSVHNLCQGD